MPCQHGKRIPFCGQRVSARRAEACGAKAASERTAERAFCSLPAVPGRIISQEQPRGRRATRLPALRCCWRAVCARGRRSRPLGAARADHLAASLSRRASFERLRDTLRANRAESALGEIFLACATGRSRRVEWVARTSEDIFGGFLVDLQEFGQRDAQRSSRSFARALPRKRCPKWPLW